MGSNLSGTCSRLLWVELLTLGISAALECDGKPGTVHRRLARRPRGGGKLTRKDNPSAWLVAGGNRHP